MIQAFAQVISKHSICSLQDKGRPGFRHWGVPVSGPMDTRAWELANALVGNSGNEAVLEVGMPALQLRFSAPAFVSVVAGNDAVVMNGSPIPFTQFLVAKGDVLELGFSQHLHFRYLAIKGGWQGPKVLNSRSTLPALGLPWIQSGAVLPYISDINNCDHEPGMVTYAPLFTHIGLLPGPDFAYVGEALTAGLAEGLTLDPQSNRQAFGWTQNWPAPQYPKKIATTASVPGMIQWTPSGHLYTLMRDAQTTGGYLQVLYIPPTYLSLLAQALPGSRVKFKLLEDIAS